jgi:uncharacterized membrane protein YgaE (UPF0421/DUF939 family)
VANSELSRLTKQGLSFALGAALLTGLFGHRADLLDNYAYPIFGFVSVVYQPTQGSAINAGLGRLGGSALGGVIAATLLSAFGEGIPAFYILPALTFILAALICETYRWEAAYSQATLIGTYIAMRVLGTSDQENIWRYLQARLVDNWIGIIIGFAVVLLFWPRGSRQALIKDTRQFLHQLPLMLGAIVHRWAPHPALAHLDAVALQTQLITLAKTSQKALEEAEDEFQGEAIYEENWGAILATQAQITRQLANLNELAANYPSDLPRHFTGQLDQFLIHVTLTCDQVGAELGRLASTRPEGLALLRQDMATMADTLEQLRSSGNLNRQSAPEVLQGFHQLELCRQLVHSLEALNDNLHKRAQEVARHRRQPLISLPKWTPLPQGRVLQIIGMGTAIAILLAIIYYINYPFPSVLYTRIASLIVVAAVLFLVQPTLTRAIAGLLGGIAVIHLLLFWVYLVANAFGFNPAGSFLLYFILFMAFAIPSVGNLAKVTEMIAGPFGFLPGSIPHSIELSRIGAIIAAFLYAEGAGPFFHQALHAASLATFMAAPAAFVISLFFIRGTEASQFTHSLAQTYRQLGQLHQALFARYWSAPVADGTSGKPTDAKLAFKIDQLAQPIEQHPLLSLVAGLELGFGPAANAQKRQWQTWVSHEEPLLTELQNLQEYTQIPPPSWLAQEFKADLQAIAQQITDRFNHIAAQIEDKPTLPQKPLLPQLEALEQQLMSLRFDSQDYRVAPLITLSAMVTTLKAMAQHLDQV